MFIHKDMHPARKTLRRILLALLCITMGFFSMIVTLRVLYRGKDVKGPLQAQAFHIDVMQHRVEAAFSYDAQDMVIVERLLRMGVFSPIYTRAGLRLLEEKADEGYAPAITRLEEIYPPKAEQ